MPPRQPALPEGTDHIVAGASGSSEGQNGFVASAGGSSGTDRLVSQVRDQVTSLRSQATDRVRGFADDGKGKVTGLLENVSEVLNDAAKSVDERLGEDYGEHAHRAAGAVADFAGRIRDKSVDDIFDDTRDFVRKSPVLAIGIAAVAGLPPFALFASEFLLLTEAAATRWWLILPLGIGLLVAAAAKIHTLQALCLGDATPDAADAPPAWTQRTTLGPIWLHLGLALVLGAALPASLTALLAAAARIPG